MMFVHRVLHSGDPTKGDALVYLVALAGLVFLAWSFWAARSDWREFVAREEITLFIAVAFICALFLAQFNYTDVYWTLAWPFAVAMLCLGAQRLLDWRPALRRPLTGAFLVILA